MIIKIFLNYYTKNFMSLQNYNHAMQYELYMIFFRIYLSAVVYKQLNFTKKFSLSFIQNNTPMDHVPLQYINYFLQIILKCMNNNTITILKIKQNKNYNIISISTNYILNVVYHKIMCHVLPLYYSKFK